MHHPRNVRTSAAFMALITMPCLRPRSILALLVTAAALVALGVPRHTSAPPASAQAPTPTTPTPAPRLGCVAKGPEVVKAASTTDKVVALTFDDGPSDYTPAFLRILAANNAQATFFEIGRNMAGHEDVMRQIIAAGDDIGDHTYDHIDLPPLSTAKANSELSRTATKVKQITGYKPCLWRPPHGRRNARTDTIARKLGLLTTLWSVDTLDFTMPGVNTIYRRAVDGAKPGAIIIMHEGEGNRSQTVAALPHILETLGARGYKFVTVSQLLGLQSLTR